MTEEDNAALYLVVHSIPNQYLKFYGEDMDCDGALKPADARTPIKLFPKKSLARKAIDISALNAQLRAKQGKVFLKDFYYEQDACNLNVITLQQLNSIYGGPNYKILAEWLQRALAGCLQHCVTPTGLPNEEDRTPEQKEAMAQAKKALHAAAEGLPSE